MALDLTQFKPVEPINKGLDLNSFQPSNSAPNLVQNEQNASKLEQFATGAGKDLIGQAKGTSDILNKISSFIPQNLKNSLAQQHPQIAGILGIISKVSPTISKIEQNVGQQPGSLTKLNTGYQKAGAVAERLVEVAPGIASLGKMAIKNIAELAAENASKISPVLENIAPKLTAKEARLALSEGRVIPGEKASWFSPSTPDTVLPSSKTIKAEQTIIRSIPNANKLDAPQLYSALETKTSEISTQLKPQMKTVGVKPETMDKAAEAWNLTKADQLEKSDSTYALGESTIQKIQNQFETRLKRIDNAKSLDDVWQERIDYDNSIHENVKKANSMSSETLQNKRTIWLQNRNIFNNIINDLETGLGEKSRQAFSDMADMYQAKEGILSNVKVKTKIQPSGVAEFAKKHPIISAGVAGTVASATGVPGRIFKLILGD